jgi:hypothetical protein
MRRRTAIGSGGREHLPKVRQGGLRTIAVLAGLALATGSMAEGQATDPGTFSPPLGCTGWLTVQSRGCMVENHYRCKADPPGDQWRVDFDQVGIDYVGRIDSETQWIESYSSLFPTVREALLPNPPDAVSFSTLLSSGLDTWEFGLKVDDGPQSVSSGYDRLTAKSVTIDGITLEETEFSYSKIASDGTVLEKSTGQQYINRDWRLFFFGVEKQDFGDSPVSTDRTPVQFIFPGEKGFFSTRPVFGCDLTTSSLQDPQTKGAPNAES